MKEVLALLTHSGEIGTNDAESIGAFGGTKGSGNFLPGFWHTNGAPGQIVIEGSAGIGKETQHIAAMLAQAAREIDGIALLDTPPAFGGGFGGGIERVPLRQYCPVVSARKAGSRR